MQRLVKGATKPKVAAPKAKYIEPLIQATYDQGHDLEQAMDALSRTLSRSPTWTTSYKTLIVIHIMIREGQQDAVLRFLSRHPRMLELDEDVARQAAGLGRYARYLGTRASQFKDTKIDYIRYKHKGKSRLHSLSVSKGLLRECESVVIQIESLLKCKLDEKVVENDVILMAFRLLVHDLLSLFQVLNEGVINLLEHFFELSRPDAEQALVVYRSFTVLTGSVISYLKVAKNLEFQTKLHVPNIKHAPTSLVSSLEIYLNDPDFEINRRQYLAEKQAHRTSRADLRETMAQSKPQGAELNRQPTLVQQARTAEQSGSTLNQVQMELERQRSIQMAMNLNPNPIQPLVPQQTQTQTQSQHQFSQHQQPPQQSAQQPAQQPLDIFADNTFNHQAQQIQMQQAQSQLHTQQLAMNSHGLQQQATGLQSQHTSGFNFGQQPSAGYQHTNYQPAQAQAQAQAPQWQPVAQPQLTQQYTGGQQQSQPQVQQPTGGYSGYQPQPVAQAMQNTGAGPNPFRASMTGTPATGAHMTGVPMTGAPMAATNTGAQNIRHSYNPFLRQGEAPQQPQPVQPAQPAQPAQPVYSQNTGMNDLLQLNFQTQQAPIASTQTGRNPFHR